MWRQREDRSQDVTGAQLDHRGRGASVPAWIIESVAVGVAAATFVVWATSLAVMAISRGASPYPPWILLSVHTIGVLFLAVGLLYGLASRAGLQWAGCW